MLSPYRKPTEAEIASCGPNNFLYWKHDIWGLYTGDNSDQFYLYDPKLDRLYRWCGSTMGWKCESWGELKTPMLQLELFDGH